MLHGSKDWEFNAGQTPRSIAYIPFCLQPFLKYSDISVASDWFSTVSWSEWAFYHILLPPGYALSIYLQPFLRYSKLLVENCDIFIPHLCLAAPSDPVGISKILIHTKLEWMGYRVVKKAWQYVQPFWYNTSVWQTDRQTDGRPAYSWVQGFTTGNNDFV